MTTPNRPTGLILLAHGSRDHAWLEAFEQLTEPARQAFPAARLAYMELARPTLAETAALLIEEGCSQLHVLPLFLAAGKHLRQDIPAMIAEIQAETGTPIKLLAPIGEHPVLGSAIAEILQQATGLPTDH